MTKIRDLQIGDKIYTVNINNNRVHEITEIIMIEENKVFNGQRFFKRQIKNGKCFLYSKAYMKYNSFMNYFIETQELKDTFEKQQLIEIISKFDFNKLNLETLKQIELLIKKIKI